MAPSRLERCKTRCEHFMDTRSARLAVWLLRVTRGRIVRLWHRKAMVLTTRGRKSGLKREVPIQYFPDGDAVVVAGPHPSGAPVPYWPIRQLLQRLLGVDEERLAAIAESETVGDPIARAGIAEILRPEGLKGRPGDSRSDAVSVALAAAIGVAAGRAESGRVALLVDDIWRCDALSSEALLRLTERMPEGPLFLVSASLPQRDPVQSDEAIKMLIRGLESEEASRMLEGLADEERPIDREMDTSPGGRLMLPLYIEQLRSLGVESLESEEGLPPRLADAVLARVERLRIAERRLLQVICVLGDSAPLDWVRELVRGTDLGAIEDLEASGFISVDGDRISVTHPFVRELVESSIPAEYRKELHAAALQVAAGLGAPLEVRAEHAWRAAEPMSALLLLERMGDSALTRGDGAAAVLAFRRGLELARRELLLTGDTALDRAIVTFSRKLGDAMDRAGDTAGADGVLREALELAGPANRERSRMLLLLSRVASRRNRARDATRFLGQALEICGRQGDRLGEAEAHLALGRLRLADGDTLTAANTLENAVKMLERERDAGPLFVQAAVAHAEALVALDNRDAAVRQLARARAVAEKVGTLAVQAMVLGALGRAMDGEDPRAPELFREASRMACDAGDARGAREWSRLGRVSESRQAG